MLVKKDNEWRFVQEYIEGDIDLAVSDPSKLLGKKSVMLRAVLEDLEKAERAENVQINMGVWHGSRLPVGVDHYDMEQEEIDKLPMLCTVCFAGCALRGLGFPDDLDLGPEQMVIDNGTDFGSRDLYHLMDDLDTFRQGTIPFRWIRDMGGYSANSEVIEIQDTGYCPYPRVECGDPISNREAFKDWVRKVADWFESKGN
jgi:hypothetical protein